MFGNLDARKIAGMMSKMGIKQEEIKAERVVIEQEDKKIVIENPQIMKIDMKGSKSFQISGDIREESKEQEITEEDIKQVEEKTGKSEKEARKALEKAKGDLAEAIISLQNS